MHGLPTVYCVFIFAFDQHLLALYDSTYGWMFFPSLSLFVNLNPFYFTVLIILYKINCGGMAIRIVGEIVFSFCG